LWIVQDSVCFAAADDRESQEDRGTHKDSRSSRLSLINRLWPRIGPQLRTRFLPVPRRFRHLSHSLSKTIYELGFGNRNETRQNASLKYAWVWRRVARQNPSRTRPQSSQKAKAGLKMSGAGLGRLIEAPRHDERIRKPARIAERSRNQE
jgi:hypothetical protein